jgi:hypothetical protein
MDARACDLSLTEALADPVVRAVMDADGVDPRKLAAELREMAAALNLFDRAPVITDARRCGTSFASRN